MWLWQLGYPNTTDLREITWAPLHPINDGSILVSTSDPVNLLKGAECCAGAEGSSLPAPTPPYP